MEGVQRTFGVAATSAQASPLASVSASTLSEVYGFAVSTSGSETPFAKLLLAVFNSILEVFLLCAAGYILARHGILDKRTQKQINRLNVSLFTPALLFSKVAFYLTPEKLRELWIVPVWFVIVTTASMFVGRVLGWVFRLSNSQKSFITAAAMFMNSNALPIALMQSLVLSVPDLAWGADDNTDAMMGRALTYLTMYSTLGMVVRYSYGVSLLSRADTINLPPSNSDSNPKSHPNQPETYTDEPAPLLLSSEPAPLIDLHPEDEEGHREGGGGGGGGYLVRDRTENENENETLHTHPSSSTLYEPYHDHEHDHELGASSSSKYTDSPGTMGSAVPLPVLPPSSAQFHQRGGGGDVTVSAVDYGRPTTGANAKSKLDVHANVDKASNTKTKASGDGDEVNFNSNPNSNANSKLRRPQSKRANTNTSFYNSFPNSPNDSRADLPAWREEGDSPRLTTTSSASESECSECESDRERQRQRKAGNVGDEVDEDEDDDEVLPGPCRATTAEEALRDLEAGMTGRPRRVRRHYHHHHHHTPSTNPSHKHTHTHTLSHHLHLKHLTHTLHRLLLTLHNFMTVPLWAALASLLVACLAPLQHALEQHLQPLNEAVATCGRCAVPLTLVVLGAYFYEGEGEGGEGEGGKGKKGKTRGWKAALGRWFRAKRKESRTVTDQVNVNASSVKAARPGEGKTVVLAILARMVLTPLLLVPLILVATMGDWHAVFEDPVFVTVNTILLCSPPALTLAQITAKASGDAFERLISRTIFWSYCVLTPPVMVVCVLWGLWVAEF